MATKGGSATANGAGEDIDRISGPLCSEHTRRRRPPSTVANPALASTPCDAVRGASMSMVGHARVAQTLPAHDKGMNALLAHAHQRACGGRKILGKRRSGFGLASAGVALQATCLDMCLSVATLRQWDCRASSCTSDCFAFLSSCFNAAFSALSRASERRRLHNGTTTQCVHAPLPVGD